MSLDVKFSATDAGFTSTVSKVKQSVKSMDDSVGVAAGSVKSSFGDMVKAGAALGLGFGALKLVGDAIAKTFGTFKDALDLGGTLADLSDQTGETAGKLLILQRAFENSGLSADQVGTSINKIQKNLVAAAEGTADAEKKFSKLGLTFSDLEGKTPTEQFKILAAAISKLPTPAEKSAAAIEWFGKSGGKSLAFMQDFSGAVANAKDELGSMPGIMDENAKKFDDVGDKINIIKNKFTEFAAGILDKILPALELFTTAFGKIDAAGLGQKLADAFLGGQKAMKGFTAAIDAISIGDFAAAFKIAFLSIELQVKMIANQIFKNLQAAFEAAANFILSVLGPDSSIFDIIANSFSILGDNFSLSIQKSLRNVFAEIPIIGDDIAKNIDKSVKNLESQIKTSKDSISSSMRSVGSDISNAAYNFGNDFTSAYNKASTLFDLTDEAKALADEIAKIAAKKEIISSQATSSVSAASDEFGKLQSEIDPLDSSFQQIKSSSDNASDGISELYRTINLLPAQKNVKVEVELNQDQQFKKDVEDLTNIINGVPNSKIVNLAIDAGGFKDLNDLKKQLDFFPDSKQVKLAISQTGYNLEELKEAVDGIPEKKRSEIALRVLGTADLEKATKILGTLTDTKIQLLCKTYGVENVDELSNALRGIPDPDLINLVAEVTGKSDIDSMNRALDTLSTKKKKYLVEVSGKKDIDAIKDSIDGLSNKKLEKKALEISGLTDVQDLKDALDLLKTKMLGLNLDVETQDASNDIGNIKSQLDALDTQARLNINTEDADKSIKGVEYGMTDLFDSVRFGLNTTDADGQIGQIQTSINDFGKDTKLNLNADYSIQAIRDAIQQPLDLDLNSKDTGSQSDKSSLENLVEAIKNAVERLETKLPMPALGY